MQSSVDAWSALVSLRVPLRSTFLSLATGQPVQSQHSMLLFIVTIWPGYAGAAAPAAPGTAAVAPPRSGEHMRLIWCYGCFGFGYIIPATFLPAMARDVISDPTIFGWARPIFGAATLILGALALIEPQNMN